MLMSNGAFVKDKKIRRAMMGVSLILSIVWVCFMAEGRLPFDRWMSPYWGDGFNPPSVNFMVYSLLVLYLCYCFFSLLGESGSSIAGKFIEILCFFGRNTLYIWLYHLLVKTFIAEKFPDMRGSNILVRLLVFGLIITLPAVMKQLVDMLLKFYEVHVCQKNTIE